MLTCEENWCNKEKKGDSLAVRIRWINGELESCIDDEKGIWRREDIFKEISDNENE